MRIDSLATLRMSDSLQCMGATVDGTPSKPRNVNNSGPECRLGINDGLQPGTSIQQRGLRACIVASHCNERAFDGSIDCDRRSDTVSGCGSVQSIQRSDRNRNLTLNVSPSIQRR